MKALTPESSYHSLGGTGLSQLETQARLCELTPSFAPRVQQFAPKPLPRHLGFYSRQMLSGLLFILGRLTLIFIRQVAVFKPKCFVCFKSSSKKANPHPDKIFKHCWKCHILVGFQG